MNLYAIKERIEEIQWHQRMFDQYGGAYAESKREAEAELRAWKQTFIHYDGESYRITRKDSVTVAIRPAGENQVKVLTLKSNGEITVIVRKVPWLHQTLKSLEVSI